MSYHRAASRFAAVACVLLASLTLATAASAAPAASGNDVGGEALRHFMAQVQTFTADFTQTQSDETGRITRKQSGQVWLQRATPGAENGRFRWAYEKPYKQLIVFDGTRVWVYDPDLQQVTVRPAGKAFAGSPAALLAARTTLTDAFDVLSSTGMNGQEHVELVPKDSQSDFKSVSLLFAGDVPVRMVFRDHLGDVTDVQFTDVKTNVHIAPGQFSFDPPKGVTVVGADGG
ncbi:MAG TPA: outer membrane lipoprotein chaperone LolA, partial [Nevskiaceae bacterium]